MQNAKNFIRESLSIIILSLIIVVPVRVFIAQPFMVSGDSMDNTFHDGNYLIVDELSYRFHAPARGDVIIFKVPPKGLELQHYAADKTVFYIKRIIGLPKETVQIDGDAVTIYNAAHPNGFTLSEPYTHIDPNGSPLFAKIQEKITLGDNEYFVMGDNRHNSSDSRLWGTLPASDIRGRALVRLFPFTQIAVSPGTYASYDTK